MERPNIYLVLLVLVGLIITLYGPSIVQAEGTDDDTTTTCKGEVDQCSTKQRKEDNHHDLQINGRETRLNAKLDELHSQLKGLDTRLSTQLNGFDTRLTTQSKTQQNDVDTRFNRINDRLDEIETMISDKTNYLENRVRSLESMVRWAIADIKESTSQPTTTPQAPQGKCAAVPDGARRDCGYSGITEQDCVTGRSCCYDASKPNVPHCFYKGYEGCEDALRHGQTTSGVYTIVPELGTSMDVYCEQQLDGGGWTVFQSRKDGSVDFYRDWNTYKAGFGQLSGEFWLGNDRIHNLTKHHDMKLKVELTSPEGEVKFADYNRFWIRDEAHKYKLTVSGFTGGSPPGDALAYHHGQYFSTKDQDNDADPRHCSTLYQGAWWYSSCHQSNLNGLYENSDSKGLIWYQWKHYEVSMEATRMMFRKRP